MKLAKFIWVLAIFTLAGCLPAQAPLPSPTIGPTSTQPAPTASSPADQPPAPNLYPTPFAYPNPPVSGDPTQPGEPLPYAPAPGDEKLMRGNVFIDSAEIVVAESAPPQYSLLITGNLPTPCHELRAEITQADTQNRINLSVYSLTDPEMMCTQVLKPFSQSIVLGSYPSGIYTVMVNGEKAGEFSAP